MIFVRIVYSKGKLTHENTAGASKSKMLDNHSWLFSEKSLDLLATARVDDVYISTTVQNNFSLL